MIKADLEKVMPKATFYLNLQHLLIPSDGSSPDPEVLQAWQTFMMMMKLTLNQSIRGLTA